MDITLDILPCLTRPLYSNECLILSLKLHVSLHSTCIYLVIVCLVEHTTSTSYPFMTFWARKHEFKESSFRRVEWRPAQLILHKYSEWQPESSAKSLSMLRFWSSRSSPEHFDSWNFLQGGNFFVKCWYKSNHWGTWHTFTSYNLV